MARTIGKVWIRKIKKMIDESGLFNCEEGFQYVKEKLPLEVFDIWEAAYSEIRRIVWDYMCSDQYKPKKEFPWQ